MIVHATTTQLAAWLNTTAPPNAATLLRSASILVSRATITAIYDVDDTGTATNNTILAALADATCSQVATWIALSIDPAKGAADAGGAIAAKSIGSASIQYASYASTIEARARAATELSQEALLILADQGLTGPRPTATR